MDRLKLECRECNLKFDTKEALVNHKEKFCTDQGYGDVTSLQTKLEAAKLDLQELHGAKSTMTVGEIRSYLRGERHNYRHEQLGKVSLEEVRNQIQANKPELQRAQAQHQVNKEREITEGLERMVLLKQKRQQRLKEQEAVVFELLQDLFDIKDQQLLNRVDVSTIDKAIRELDDGPVDSHSREVLNEMKKLRAEREALRIKQEDYFNQLAQFKEHREQQTERLSREQERYAPTGAEGAKNREYLEQLEAEVDAELTERLEGIALSRKLLKFERDRIMEDYAKLKEGDLTSIRNRSVRGQEVQLPKWDPRALKKEAREMQGRMAGDLDRLNKLKVDHQDFMRNRPIESRGQTPVETKHKSSINYNARSAGRLIADIEKTRTEPGVPSKPPPPNYSTPAFNMPMMPWMYMPPPPPQKRPELDEMKKEIKRLNKQLSAKPKDEVYSGMTSILNSLNRQLNSEDVLDLYPEERALSQIAAKESQELRLLAHLPQDDEVYRMKMDHYKEASQVRQRMLGMFQELQVERLRRQMDNEFGQRDKEHYEDHWNHEIKKGGFKPKGEHRPQSYHREAGFYLYWDWVTGVPRKFRHVSLVYGVYDQGRSLLKPTSVPGADVENDSYSDMTGRAIFAQESQIKQVEPIRSRLIVLEVTGAGSRASSALSSLGWTVLELFEGAKVNEGAWKLPLYKPPTDLNVTRETISKSTQVANLFLFMRMTNPVAPNPSVTSIPLIPEDSVHSYMIPEIHMRQLAQPNREFSARTDSKPGSRQKEANPMTNSGIAVRLESLQNYITKGQVKIQVNLQIGHENARDEEGNPCSWTSDRVNTLIKDFEKTGFLKRIPGTNVKVDRAMLGPSLQSNVIEIGQETAFFNNFFNVLQAHKNEQSLFLLFTVMERVAMRLGTPARDLDTTDYEVVGWTVLQVSNAASNSFNYGTLELNLYQPPVIHPVRSPEDLVQFQGTLKVTVYEPSPDIFVPGIDRKPVPIQPVQSLSQSASAVLSDPFLENLKPQHEATPYFEYGDGVDFYVDAARFLPDNVTCTKVVVRAVNANLERVGEPVGGLSELKVSAYHPVFGLRHEFRELEFNPTTTLLLSLVTIDAKREDVRVVGYCAINMFLDKFRKEQPSDPHERDFLVNTGCFQLPIYCQEINRMPPFSMQSFRKIEVIPCATLLVRIRLAARSDDGLRVLSTKDVPADQWYRYGIVVPPPKYSDGVYNTAHCMPSANERTLYHERHNRPDITVKDATVKVQHRLGYRLDLNDEQMYDWIDSKLQQTSRSPFLDLTYFARYNPRMGFRFSVDALHTVSSNLPHIVLYCLNPPASLYQTAVITQDVGFTNGLDWNSSVRTPQFIEGFRTFKNVVLDPFLTMIIDVRAVSFTTKPASLVHVGWSVLQIFNEDGYVASGYYQLPVFKGPVPVNIIEALGSNRAWDVINGNKSLQLLESLSVLVRLVDSQRFNHLMVPLDTTRMVYSFIPKPLLPRLAFTAEALSKTTKDPRLQTIVPSRGAVEPFQQRVNETVGRVLGLN
jgi:hypothetical protein